MHELDLMHGLGLTHGLDLMHGLGLTHELDLMHGLGLTRPRSASSDPLRGDLASQELMKAEDLDTHHPQQLLDLLAARRARAHQREIEDLGVISARSSVTGTPSR